MRKFASSVVFASHTASKFSAYRWCSSSTSSGDAPSSSSSAGPAPKKARKYTGIGPKSGASAVQGLADLAESQMQQTAASMPTESTVEARQSHDDIKRQMDELSKLPPEELEALIAKFNEQEEAGSNVLAQDQLYQMDVSTKQLHQGAPKVFWKDVKIEKAISNHKGWYHITVDGRKVKAFETTQNLIVPGKSYALAIAAEWGRQQKFVNKLSMPLTDLASGAQHVAPQMIQPRIDYLMSFFPNDNLYFRSEAIQAKQDALIDPIANWYSRVYDFDVPRVVGIGHPHTPADAQQRVRDSLMQMNLNQYQIVALCVMAQCCASLMLPLALVNRVTTIRQALEINQQEEKHNTSSEGMIEGYHDIRESDQICKLAASLNGWRMASDYPLAQCSRAHLAQQQPNK